MFIKSIKSIKSIKNKVIFGDKISINPSGIFVDGKNINTEVAMDLNNTIILLNIVEALKIILKNAREADTLNLCKDHVALDHQIQLVESLIKEIAQK